MGEGYPEIEQHHTHVDTLAYAMVISPEQLQVIVAENRAGDCRPLAIMGHIGV